MTVLACAALCAQAQITPPKPKAVTPPDLSRAIAVLEADKASDNQGIPPMKPPEPVKAGKAGAPPAGWETKPVELPAEGKRALEIQNQEWLGGVAAPSPGKDGRVIFTFGAGLPVIPCKPMTVTVVELEPGEHVTSAPLAGDSIRWIISPAYVGKEPGITSLLVIKPLQAGLETNLVVATDKRAYYLRLFSTPDQYVARVGFAYPEDPAVAWSAQQKKMDETKETEKAKATVEPLTSIENINTDYIFKGKDRDLTPVWMGDNGKKTFLKMNPATGSRDLPVLMVHGAGGTDEIVNFRVSGDLYIVDRLIDSGSLRIGVGKKARKVEFTRTQKAAVK